MNKDNRNMIWARYVAKNEDGSCAMCLVIWYVSLAEGNRQGVLVLL